MSLFLIRSLSRPFRQKVSHDNLSISLPPLIVHNHRVHGASSHDQKISIRSCTSLITSAAAALRMQTDHELYAVGLK